VDPEAAFLAGYALLLVLGATGLAWLGQRSTDPSTSRLLAANRDREGPGPRHGNGAEWPHSESPVFHLGLSAVALAAALVLVIASLARHHAPLELTVHLPLLALIETRLVATSTAHRSLRSVPGPSPVRGGPHPEERSVGPR